MIQNKLGRGAGSKENHREKKETYLHMIQTQELSKDFKITMTYMFKMREKMMKKIHGKIENLLARGFETIFF